MATKPNYPGQPGNINATPSTVSPTGGSSTEAPPSYNPMDAARTNEKIAKGIPATPDYFAQGVQLMSPCHLCGRAFSETPGIGGPSLNEHIQSHNESPYMRFGDSDYEV